MEQRAGVATFKGNPLTLIGPQLKPGDSAPDFEVLGQDLTPVKRSNFAGRTLLISAVPSLDTPVCDAQTRRFNEEAAKLPNVHILAISMDLPFAQKRWCGASGAGHIQVVSDHKNAAFGKAYGVLIKELRLLSRSIFIIDGAGVIRYVEYVPEVTSHPNYDAALTAARQIAKS
ncbi:MAG: thiol peroxidase [Candidatus Omnitrophica bacterium]|nr:thiol peroxidase [Candidatus Omnitrophota bacterium]